MPNPNELTELHNDIAELRKEAPAFYQKLEENMAAHVQSAVQNFVDGVHAIPFQTCVQILLGTDPTHQARAIDVLQHVKAVFQNLEPRAEHAPEPGYRPLSVDRLEETLNWRLDPYNLISHVGPYDLLQHQDGTAHRAGVGVRIVSHPRVGDIPCWLEMHFTSFAQSKEEAWVNLRIRILNLLGV
jgi:hypothetical protein